MFWLVGLVAACGSVADKVDEGTNLSALQTENKGVVVFGMETLGLGGKCSVHIMNPVLNEGTNLAMGRFLSSNDRPEDQHYEHRTLPAGDWALSTAQCRNLVIRKVITEEEALLGQR